MVSLGEARREAEMKPKKLVSDGIDPSERKKQIRLSKAKPWHSSCCKGTGILPVKRKWSDSHSERVLKAWRMVLFTAIGRKNIRKLNTRDLIAIKAVEASGRLEVASRLQQKDYGSNAICRPEWSQLTTIQHKICLGQLQLRNEPTDQPYIW